MFGVVDIIRLITQVVIFSSLLKGKLLIPEAYMDIALLLVVQFIRTEQRFIILCKKAFSDITESSLEVRFGEKRLNCAHDMRHIVDVLKSYNLY